MERTPWALRSTVGLTSQGPPPGLSNIHLSRCISHIPGPRKDQVLTTPLAPASLCLCPCFPFILSNTFLKPESPLHRQPSGGVLYDPHMLWGCPCLERKVPLALPVKPHPHPSCQARAFLQAQLPESTLASPNPIIIYCSHFPKLQSTVPAAPSAQVDQCGALMNIHKCHLLHEAYTIPTPVPRRPPSPGSSTMDTAPMSLPSCAVRVTTLTLQRLESHRLPASLYLVSLHAGRVAHSRLSEDARHENKTIHIPLNARPPGKSP